MRVVFLEDVPGVAQGGDVKEVKNGYARNYLIPKSLAVPVSHNSLQRIEGLKKRADETRIKMIADIKVVASELDGKQINIEMRAGAEGKLYGSVTNSMVADELSKIIDSKVDRRTVEIPEPIRDLGTYELVVRLHAEVQATITVLVYAEGTEPTSDEDSMQDEVDDGDDNNTQDDSKDASDDVDEDVSSNDGDEPKREIQDQVE